MQNNSILDVYEIDTRNWIAKVPSNLDDFKMELVERFQFVRAYHASKKLFPDDFSGVLKPSSDEVVKGRALRIFTGRTDSEIQKITDIVQAFSLTDPGDLHYCLNRAAFTDAYQYHLYGSEDLMRIADLINEALPTFGARRLLIESGLPVIVHFDISIKDLSEQEIEEYHECFLDCDSVSIHCDRYLETFIHHNSIPTIVQVQKVVRVANKFGKPDW